MVALASRPLGLGARSLAAAALIGLAWGVFCWWGDDSSWTLIRGAANTAGPWLVIAFWAGSQSRRWPESAALGVLSLLAAVLGYYGAIEALDPIEAPYRISMDAGVSWAVVAIPAGALAGAAGSAWRAGGWLGTIAVGLLAGALFGEGLLLLRDTSWSDIAYLAVPVAEITAAFALVVALLDRRDALRGVVIAGVSGPLMLVVLETVMLEVRARLDAPIF